MTVLDTTSDFPTALRQATTLGTGCLVVGDATGTRSGRIFLREGRIYSVLVDGFLPKIAQRLRTGGMVDDDSLGVLLAECGNDPYASDAGERAVAAGMVERDVLQAVHRELLLSSIGAMRTWEAPRVKFKRHVETARFVISAVSVEAVLRALDRRAERWAALWHEIAPGAAVEDVRPRALPAPPADGDPLTFEAEAVAAAADGTRSVDEVAGECGLTRFETGHVLAQLVSAGRAEVPGAAAPAGDQQAAHPDRTVPPGGRGLPVSPEAYLAVPSPEVPAEPAPCGTSAVLPAAPAGSAAAGEVAAEVADEVADDVTHKVVDEVCDEVADEVSDEVAEVVRAAVPEPAQDEPSTGAASEPRREAEPEGDWSDEPAPDRSDVPVGPVVIDHSDDDDMHGPRLAPDVLAANEHVDDTAQGEDDTECGEDLPTWGEPVDDLPDGLYLEPVPIDMPEVVFEALADGVSNRSVPTEHLGAEDDDTSGPEERGVDEQLEERSEQLTAQTAVADRAEAVPGRAPEDDPTGAARRAGLLEIPVAMPRLDTSSEPAPAGATAAATLPVAPPTIEDAGALAAAEAERIAAAEAVRVEAETQAEERTERQAALDRALSALAAAQAEAERSEVACEELRTSRTRVEESVDRLAEAVAVAEDELALVQVTAEQARERLEQGVVAEDQARADLAEAEAALAAAQATHDSAVERLATLASARTELDTRAAAAAADHRHATERSARLKAEERLARDAAAVSVRAHAAAEALAAAARESVAEAALRVERARSRVTQPD